MDLVKIIKVDCSNCILLGDFNTAIGIMDSAYAENDLDITGYLSVFRSMSDWLETLLSPEECFFYLLFMARDGGCGMIDCFRALHPSERNAYSCFNTKLKGRVNNFGTRIDYIVCTCPLRDCLVKCVIRSDVTGSDHLPVVAGLVVCRAVMSRVRFFGEEPECGGGITVEGGRTAEDSVVLSSESGWKEGRGGEKLTGSEGENGVCGVWR